MRRGWLEHAGGAGRGTKQPLTAADGCRAGAGYILAGGPRLGLVEYLVRHLSQHHRGTTNRYTRETQRHPCQQSNKTPTAALCAVFITYKWHRN